MSDASPVRLRDLARPRLPLPLRAFNAVGGPLMRRAVRFDEARLLEAARRRTGLDDFGDQAFRKPLGLLLRAFESEARLSPLGRFLTRQHVLQLLSSRLLLEDLVKRHPEILEERIERPLVIAGLPRTGTTHLHNLVTRHPDLRWLPYWESLEPVPAPGGSAKPGAPDPRITRCQQALKLLDWAMPHFRAMHEMTWDSPHEEIQLLAIDFATMLFEASYHVPSYRDWYKAHDHTPSYAYLKRVLQALQWLRPGGRWALKSPQHLEQLAPLMAVFPDARVIQTHRDPLRITASISTMIAYGSRMQAARVEPARIGRYWAGRVADLLRGSIEGRRHLPAGRVFDVHFREFMKDGAGTTERVLAFAEVPVTDAAARAIREHTRDNPRGKHGVIAYHLEDVGLDAAELRQALRFYQERFDIPDE